MYCFIFVFLYIKFQNLRFSGEIFGRFEWLVGKNVRIFFRVIILDDVNYMIFKWLFTPFFITECGIFQDQ